MEGLLHSSSLDGRPPATQLTVLNLSGETIFNMSYSKAVGQKIADLRRLIKTEKGLRVGDCLTFLHGFATVEEDVSLEDLWPPLGDLTLQMLIEQKSLHAPYPIIPGEILSTLKDRGDLIVVARQGRLAERHPDIDNVLKQHRLEVIPYRTVIQGLTADEKMRFRIKDMPDPGNPFQSSVMKLETQIFHSKPGLFLLGSAEVTQTCGCDSRSAFVRTAASLWLVDLCGLVCNLVAILWALSSASFRIWLPLVATIGVLGCVLSLLGITVRANRSDRANRRVSNVIVISKNYLLCCFLYLPCYVCALFLLLCYYTFWCCDLLLLLLLLCCLCLPMVVWLLLMVVWMSFIVLYSAVFPFGAFFCAIVFPCVQIITIGCRGARPFPVGRSLYEVFMVCNVIFGDLPRVVICCTVLSHSTPNGDASKALRFCLGCSTAELLLAVLRHRLKIIRWAFNTFSGGRQYGMEWMDEAFDGVFLFGFWGGNYILSLCGFFEQYLGTDSH